MQPQYTVSELQQLLGIRLEGVGSVPADTQAKLQPCMAAFGGFTPEYHEITSNALLTWQKNPDKVIYFLLDHETGRIKIGNTKNLKKRLAALRTGLARSMSCIGVLLGKVRLEKSLHQLFGDIRKQGEWFALSPHLIAFVIQYTQVPWDQSVLRVEERWNLRLPENTATVEAVKDWIIDRHCQNSSARRRLLVSEHETKIVDQIIKYWSENSDLPSFGAACSAFTHHQSHPDPEPPPAAPSLANIVPIRMAA